MKIGIIDADLLGRDKHRFPNLVCEKISAYWKEKGAETFLLLDYDHLDDYDEVYISKVFTDTPCPQELYDEEWLSNHPNIHVGGTGFYFDKAPNLPDEIEHHMPDYHLYDDWVEEQLRAGGKAKDFTYYRDYSIGFLTRGCFRGCEFCVNKNYKRVVKHSTIDEFLDESRPKICLLDDNFLGHHCWKEMLLDLQSRGKPFQFKQGLDERLLTDESCGVLFRSKYDGDYIFAFDNISDSDLIERKIILARKYTTAALKFYCFCGFDRGGKWDDKFWRDDIFDLLKRIEILAWHGCVPYVMRYARYMESPYRGLYVSIARWCNQPNFFKKKSLREFAEANGLTSACYRYVSDFERKFPEVAFYFDMKYCSPR